MAIRVDLANYDEVMRDLEDCPKDLAKGVRKTMLAMTRKSGGVLTVARAEIPKVYNIKAKDVTEKYKGKREVGGITLAGVKIPFFDVEFESKGTLTPARFGMKPKNRYAHNRAYTVTWQPLKAGGRREVPSDTGYPVFLAPNPHGGRILPWNRMYAKSWGKATGEWKHLPINAIHTHMSVPQMLDNAKVQPHVQREVERRLEKLLQENLK
ncbi:MAG: hypothetical protein IJ087_00155 [Eggerthellaceae bacterium]|nr:hypothetical protein [Eggerthellaceae bacterium]